MLYARTVFAPFVVVSVGIAALSHGAVIQRNDEANPPLSSTLLGFVGGEAAPLQVILFVEIVILRGMVNTGFQDALL